MFLTRVGEVLARKGPSYPVSEVPGVLFGVKESSAGVSVTGEDALSLSAVFAAVNLLSRVIGTLPLAVYRQSGRNKDQALTHPAFKLLKSQPNPEMTASSFRRVLEVHRLLWGNAYAEVQWAGNYNPVALWPVEPWRVEPKRDEQGTLYYRVDQSRRVEAEDMLHVPLISFDGVSGASFVDYALESLGLGIGTQEFAARYFGNGARPGGILRHPGNPSQQARNEQKRAWEERHQGPAKGHRVAVMWGGWEYHPDGSNSAQDAQLLESRRFTVEEVARWLNIPPHMLRDLTRSSFSNIEHQGIDFVVYTLSPVLVDYEQEYDKKLLSPPVLYSKHNVAALLRGDSSARAAFYNAMFNIGVYSQNDIREFEDLNPIEEGDHYWVPLNMTPLDLALAEPEPEPAPPPVPPPPEAQPDLPPQDLPPEDVPQDLPPQPAPERQSRLALAALLEDTLDRLSRVEITAARRLGRKPGALDEWLGRFYAAHQGNLAEALAPVLDVLRALTHEAKVPPAETLAFGWCAQSREDLERLAERVTPKEWAAGLQATTETWTTRPAELCRVIIEGAYHAEH